jgi:hypothetical protein
MAIPNPKTCGVPKQPEHFCCLLLFDGPHTRLKSCAADDLRQCHWSANAGQKFPTGDPLTGSLQQHELANELARDLWIVDSIEHRRELHGTGFCRFPRWIRPNLDPFASADVPLVENAFRPHARYRDFAVAVFVEWWFIGGHGD